MKTIEQEIRERLAEQQLSPESINEVMKHIKGDPLMRGIRHVWSHKAPYFGKDFLESTWVSAWSSARDWILAQLTAPVGEEE